MHVFWSYTPTLKQKKSFTARWAQNPTCRPIYTRGILLGDPHTFRPIHVFSRPTRVPNGCSVDCHLSFETFLKSTIKKVNYKLYLFSKIRSLLTFAAAVLVYKQIILPFFDYLNILIDSRPKKYIDRLQVLQFRGIKIIYQYHIDGI